MGQNLEHKTALAQPKTHNIWIHWCFTCPTSHKKHFQVCLDTQGWNQRHVFEDPELVNVLYIGKFFPMDFPKNPCWGKQLFTSETQLNNCPETPTFFLPQVHDVAVSRFNGSWKHNIAPPITSQIETKTNQVIKQPYCWELGAQLRPDTIFLTHNSIISDLQWNQSMNNRKALYKANETGGDMARILVWMDAQEQSLVS